MNKAMVALAGLGGGAIALFFGGQAFVSHVAAKEIDKAIVEVSPFAAVEYKKVKTSFLSQGTTVKDVVITPVDSGEAIKVDEIVVYDFDTKSEIPTHVKMAMNGMSMSTEALGENAAMFSELGYDKDLALSFATEYEYEEGDKTIQLKQFKMGADEVGDVDMSFQLANVELDEKAIASLPFSLFGVEFREANLTYSDDSLINRLFETTAAAEGKSVKEVKAEAIAGLKEDSELSELLTAEQIKEIEKFINNPKGFSISMLPEAPVPLSSLMTAGDGDAIAKLLNVSFKAK